MKYLFTSLSVCCLVRMVFSQDSNTLPVVSSKKSIFATSDNLRANSFVSRVFAPLIDDESLEQISEGDYTCGSPSKFRFDSGFEVHSPYTPYHESGGLDVETVEFHYAAKWYNLMSSPWQYDAILDNSMAFWVTDLGQFYGYYGNELDRVYLKWNWQGNTYYSMIVHNREDKGDINQMELISNTFTGIEEISKVVTIVDSEPRAYINENGNANYQKMCETAQYSAMPIGIRRAVSNLDQNVDWYLSIFASAFTDLSSQVFSGESIDGNGNTVRYAFLLLDETDGFTVSFFERKGQRETFGELSIAEFEKQMNSAHEQIMVNPFCCVDRWYDMHYAIPFTVNHEVIALRVLQKAMRSGGRYTVYIITEPQNFETAPTEIGMFWALVEPNGQMVQIPGITADLITGESEASGSVIKFFTEPTYWDGTWCPMTNTDAFNEYGFGDDIALIIVGDNTGTDDDSENTENGRIRSMFKAFNADLSPIYLSVASVVAMMAVLGVLGMLCVVCSIGKSFFGGKYKEIGKDNKVDTLKTGSNYDTFRV